MPNPKRQRQREGRATRQQQLLAAQRRAATRRRMLAAAVIVGVIALIGGVLFTLGGDETTEEASTSTTATTAAPGTAPEAVDPVPPGRTISGDTPCPNADGEERASSFEKAPPMCIDPAKTYVATFETTEGDIEVELDTENVPGTVNNFVVLSRYQYYDGSAIHRTDPSIDIIQGGSPAAQSASDPGPGYTIKDEGDPSSRRYSEGDLVMARSQGPDSGGAQFFFVAGPKASALDAQGTYVTFGKVTKGLDIVKRILGLHIAFPPEHPNASLGGGPRRAVVVEDIKIEEK